jgi:hypothetical protein
MTITKTTTNSIKPNFDAEELPAGHEASHRQDTYRQKKKKKRMNNQRRYKYLLTGTDSLSSDRKRTYPATDGPCRAIVVLRTEGHGLGVF